jgi:hypothetical protein
LVPAVLADWQNFVLVENVKLNLTVAALAVPRIPARFSHNSFTLGNSFLQLFLRFKLLRLSVNRKSRETHVKVNYEKSLVIRFVFVAKCCRDTVANNRTNLSGNKFCTQRCRKDLGVFGLFLPILSAPRKYSEAQ